MSKTRLEAIFKEANRPLLSVFLTAGFPELNDTVRIASALDKAGVDFLEIGIPFSDPVADGVVIQQSSERALKNGMNLQLLFQQLKELRKVSKIPFLMMGYLNPIQKYGMEHFLKACVEVDASGTIIPDLPLKEFQTHYQKSFEEHGLANIFLISPSTVDARISEIDRAASGFIYMVSSSQTTGGALGQSTEAQTYFEKVKALKLKNPCVIGFGIKDKGSFDFATRFAKGAIIGSAFIRSIETGGDLEAKIEKFVRSIRGMGEER